MYGGGYESELGAFLRFAFVLSLRSLLFLDWSPVRACGFIVWLRIWGTGYGMSDEDTGYGPRLLPSLPSFVPANSGVMRGSAFISPNQSGFD